MAQNYTQCNAKNVLAKVNELIKNYKKPYHMDDVFEELSIFDWWTDNLNLDRLKDMRSFLNTAISLGYTGYVCFKVGCSGCANGMWAHKMESTNGFSPDDTEILYHSFTPDYREFEVKKNGIWITEFNTIHTRKELKEFLANA